MIVDTERVQSALTIILYILVIAFRILVNMTSTYTHGLLNVSHLIVPVRFSWRELREDQHLPGDTEQSPVWRTEKTKLGLEEDRLNSTLSFKQCTHMQLRGQYQ